MKLSFAILKMMSETKFNLSTEIIEKITFLAALTCTNRDNMNAKVDTTLKDLNAS